MFYSTRITALLAPLLLWALPAIAQSNTDAVADNSAASAYSQRHDELEKLQPTRAVAAVNELVLKRDAGQLTLESGTLSLLTSIGGRTVGAAFTGRGVFSFSPPTRMEQERLARFEKAPSLTTRFTELILLFADTTLTELRRQLVFKSGKPPGSMRGRVANALEHVQNQESGTFDPDLMAAFLNGDSTDLFYAYVHRERGDPLMFMINPNLNEGVQLATRVRPLAASRDTEVISQFPRQGDTTRATTYLRRGQAHVRHYAINTRLEHTAMGDVRFSASAQMRIVADARVGPWIPLRLFSELEIDSARWAGGKPAVVLKPEHSPVLWVYLGGRLSPGDARTLRVSYRGDLVDRYGDWFFIKSSAAWYPLPLDGRNLATFDLTYHTPASLVLASVGERKDSSLADRTITTRWVTPAPIQFAAFNVGRFKEHRIRETGVPPITVLVSEEAHKALTRRLLRGRTAGPGPQRNMKEVVGADVLNSMKFFARVFGEPPVRHFYATEVPYFHGQAFPGLVHLSWTTFRHTQDDGFDKFFRAHEVAHQWWGLGLDYTTYHEQWLSEGFASFAGLWYLQTTEKGSAKYFDMLDRWRADILNRKDEPAPVWLGWRNSSGVDESGYGIIVYYKGAWVLHMLRTMMLDLKAMNEDRFIGMMRDFYRSYRGTRASTDDFRRVVERHIGADMGWFFDQWVYRSAIPSYRVAYRTEPAGNREYRVRLRVEQRNVPAQFQAYVPVSMDLGNDRVARARVKVSGARSEIELPLTLPAKPKSVRFNDLDGVLAEVKMVEWKD